MGPKRQRSASANAYARKKREDRQRESAIERNARLAVQRVRSREKRQRESSTEREARLAAQRIRSQEERQRASSVEREARLSAKRAKSLEERQNESSTEREARLAAQRIRSQEERQRASSIEREARLSAKRAKSLEERQKESSTEREARLAAQRIRSQEERQRESSIEREARLSAKRAKSLEERQKESLTEREARLAAQRIRSQEERQRESSIEREARLSAKRVKSLEERQKESSTEREARLAVQRIRSQEERQRESSTEKGARLAHQRVRQTKLRAAETPENNQQTSRKAADLARHSAARASETFDQTQARLAAQQTRQTAVRAIKWQNKRLAAFQYHSSINYEDDPMVQIGGMSIICKHCGAKKWKAESPGMCCAGGKVLLAPLTEQPLPLKSLLTDNNRDSQHFLTNIRKYNSCFQMTSFGTTGNVQEQGWMPTFKVQGQVYHLAGSLLPLPNEEPKFLQIYFMGDEQQQVQQRCKNIPTVREGIVLDLQEMLYAHNNYVKSFFTALNKLTQPDCKVIIHADRTPTGQHERRFNAPNVSEVAVLISGQEFNRRDIILEQQDGKLIRISETNKAYDALQYPLIFWKGEDGYHFEHRRSDGKKVSANDFYAYRIMVRQGDSHILKYGQLFHQFIVDMYAKVESERLCYIRQNQNRLRVESYVHLRDAVANDGHAANVGQLIILPSSFTGGPRYMHEYTQDAITYVRNYGRPDLFITFTCNPTWPEITAELMPGQTAHDRHDLLARVFRQKVISLMNLITKGAIFGDCRCYMYSIEWQKRGLPHIHILVWLRDKVRTTQVDDIISAEIPNPTEDKILHEVVVKHMLHGPCGPLNPHSPCMKEGKCTKRYPRPLLQETQTDQDGYPLYRRRKPGDGGFTTVRRLRQQEIVIDNQWVVPFNPLLSCIFKAHINVEACYSVKSIKYVLKYVNKGSDQAVFGLQKEGNRNDEVSSFQTGRYISSNEAVWRILNFPIHERHPSVMHLEVHLENGERVYFTEETALQKAQQPPKTKLTAFFELCKQDAFARNLLYCEVPRYYTWKEGKKEFHPRKQGATVLGYSHIRSSEVLGRVYTVHPSNSECFYLRLLLHSIRGPVSFQDLKTSAGYVCETYREACQRRGLLEDDAHWNSTLEEAAVSHSPRKIRSLFAIVICACSPSNPQELWHNHQDSMTEDILSQAQQESRDPHLEFTSAMYNQTLILIENTTLSMAGKDLEQCGLPAPVRTAAATLSREMLQATSYDIQQLQQYIHQNEQFLVPDQKRAYTRIKELVISDSGEIVFLDAPGGTGKTFLINLLLAKIRSLKQIAVAVASSGIAATLLTGGRTAHSAFKLPLNLAHNESPVCNIGKGSGQAEVLKQAKLIVWDECTMSHKLAFEALDRTLQDLRGNTKLMGGVTVLLSGDFRQTLPVIPNGTPADELRACLKESYIWRRVEKLHLSTNMRVALNTDVSESQFANVLLQIDNGQLPVDAENGNVSIPKNCGTVINTSQEMLLKVYPNLSQNYKNHEWLCEHAILAPKNDIVKDINAIIIQQLPEQSRLYKSVDSVVDPDDAVNYPTEFLNSLQPTGVPPHNLQLKVGAPIMLLRNLDAPKLCNGTRLVVKTLMSHVIEATIMTGCAKGEDVFIPRIPIIPTDMPFPFKRLQFPVRLSFAMTINKSQGQSFKIAGIELTNPCFSHGQLYVACSRVGASKHLFIRAPNHRTRNVIYPKALGD